MDWRGEFAGLYVGAYCVTVKKGPDPGPAHKRPLREEVN
jgi:hypothetical protein